ncbi:phage tail sheath family protein [Pedobacter mendelii]|uniref:Tail sheath protein C-terminal domain-containing protein n=1 Tax=Pedobacter mendelii TaxID=1908240 RepID=A0ABQ2BJM2_9SPHI|nr:phage tail sheath C-terminal domain-containing protein [Pedobacter mendelii]GGI25806.1 hypothetical protein GCM10008119_19510 [Pedobacter mendelii]
MSKTYKVPGVYIEEVNKFPISVADVGTAIPAFIGRTQFYRDENGLEIVRSENVKPKPIRINSFLDYQKHFGGFCSEHQIFTTIVTDTTDIAGVIISRKIKSTVNKTLLSGNYMYYAIQMFYGNGGGPCYIISTGDYSSTFNNENGDVALEASSKVDEVTMLIFTDKHAENDGIRTGYKLLYGKALNECKKLGDRIAIFDPWIVSGNTYIDADIIRADFENNNLEYGCTYYPWLQTTMFYGYNGDELIISHKNGSINGAFDGMNLTAIKAIDSNTYELIKAEVNNNKIDLPPSSAVAGIMVHVDNNRGVWKAPANETIIMTTLPTVKVTSDQQESLTIDTTTGKSINVIRFFPERGTIIWGARTLKGNDNEWKYISVRRFFNYVEESIKKSTGFVVFEPNEASTWIKVKSMCDNFLNQLWRNGALQGAKPNEAFFVNIGLGVTMTNIDILEGKIIIEIGLAAVRPAEFIILRFSCRTQSS